MPRGKKAPWSDDGQILRNALDLARRPVNGSQTGGYAQAVQALQTTLDTMNGLQGDELRRYADRHAITKPELAEAITKLQTLQRQARQHFRSAYLRSQGPGAALDADVSPVANSRTARQCVTRFPLTPRLPL